MTELQCPRCGTRMEEGHVPDAAHFGMLTRAVWHAGAPEFRGSGLDIRPRTHGYRMEAWRCEGCGLVEFYAREAVRRLS